MDRRILRDAPVLLYERGLRSVRRNSDPLFFHAETVSIPYAIMLTKEHDATGSLSGDGDGLL